MTIHGRPAGVGPVIANAEAATTLKRLHTDALDFAELVTLWLTDPEAWEWFAPPLPEETIAAIHRRLAAAAN